MFLHCIIFVSAIACMAAQGFLLVSDRNTGIHRVNVTSGAKTLLPLPHTGKPVGLTHDPANGRVIWFDGNSYQICSAQFDGSNFKVEQKTRNYIYTMVYDGASKYLYYSDGSTLKKHRLEGSSSNTVDLAHNVDSGGQLALHPDKSNIYYIDADEHHVWSVGSDGSGKNSAFHVSSDIELRGLMFDLEGLTLYASGHTSGNTLYYTYDVKTRIMTTMGRSQHGVATWRLVTDGTTLFMADNWYNKMYAAPLNSPAVAKEFSGPWSANLECIQYVHVSAECIKRPTQRYRVRVADDTLGGKEVASVPISPNTQCSLTGDTDAAATFDVATKNGTCHVFLKPGKGFDLKTKQRYNIALESTGSCPWITPEEANMRVEVYPGAGCQPLPESSVPGDVALEIPIGYHSQAKPLSVVLHEDTRGEEEQFAIKSPVLAADGNVTATAQVVLTKKVDLENPTSHLHRFRVELEYCVEVTDANDNKPVFLFPDVTKRSLVQWKEEQTGVITTVQATDSDKEKFGTAGLRYFIVLDPTSGRLFVDAQTGEVRAVTKIDKETSPGHLQVIIEARDNDGNPPYNKAVSVLTIKLQDINDNAPRFTKTTYPPVSVLDLMPDGAVVREVTATDDDEGANAQIDYSFISSSAPLPFVIESSTGSIKVAGSLRSKAGTYNVVVRATDRGTPPLSSTATVVIQVQSITAFPGRRRRDA